MRQSLWAHSGLSLFEAFNKYLLNVFMGDSLLVVSNKKYSGEALILQVKKACLSSDRTKYLALKIKPLTFPDTGLHHFK